MEKDYEEGTIILADRYTTSNMVHQAVKIEDSKMRDEFYHGFGIQNLRKWGFLCLIKLFS